MGKRLKFLCLAYGVLSCSGTDFIDDSVPAQIRITNSIHSLENGQSHQYKARYFDIVGVESLEKTFRWESTQPHVASIDSSGLLRAHRKGTTHIWVRTTDALGNGIAASDSVEVAESTRVEQNVIRGTLTSTSNYLLEGSFRLEKTPMTLTLYLENDYRADRNLPRLVVYLSNNRNTIQNAYRIATVEVFEGAHQYNLPSEIGLMDYKYLLYWCEPFLVDVGEGILIPDS